MNIAVISFYESYPPVCGAAVVTYNFATKLPGEKHLIQLSRDRNGNFKKNDLNIHNFRLSSDNIFRKFFNVILQIPKITNTLRVIKPDIVVLEGASWTFYYLLLYSSIKLARLSAKIIYHAHNVEFRLRLEKNNRLIAHLTKFSESRLMTKSDICTAVSPQDKELFKRIYGVLPYVLPNGVASESFNSVESSEVERIRNKYNLFGKICLFMGLPGYLPNKEGIDFLIHEVFPDLLAKNDNIRLAIIGGEVKEKRSWIINPGVIPFEDVPPFIRACDICVAPIFSGSGTRLKILEYLAAGKPVVSTNKGIEGLALENKRDVLIADDSLGFRNAIEYLGENNQMAEEIGNRGKKTVSTQYSWQKIISDFLPTVENLLERKSASL